MPYLIPLQHQTWIRRRRWKWLPWPMVTVPGKPVDVMTDEDIRKLREAAIMQSIAAMRKRETR